MNFAIPANINEYEIDGNAQFLNNSLCQRAVYPDANGNGYQAMSIGVVTSGSSVQVPAHSL
jgi:hypothetical protein